MAAVAAVGGDLPAAGIGGCLSMEQYPYAVAALEQETIVAGGVGGSGNHVAGDTRDKLAERMESTDGVAGVDERDRAVDADAGGCGGATDGAVSASGYGRRVAGEYRLDGVVACSGGGIDFPRSGARDVHTQHACSDMGYCSDIQFCAYAVLRLLAANAVGGDVRVYAMVDGEPVGADVDAFCE